jgi:hypothetical protein
MVMLLPYVSRGADGFGATVSAAEGGWPKSA